MKSVSGITSKLIAPCGMNCVLCIAHLREKNTCPGCRMMGENVSQYFKKCSVRNCSTMIENKMKFCSDSCDSFPCKRLKNLDKRYRSKYGMSMLDNLGNIKESGVRRFVENERNRWQCEKCGNVLCVHRNSCIYCGTEKRLSIHLD